MTEADFSARFTQYMPLRVGADRAASCLVVPELDGPFCRADFAQVEWTDPRPPTLATIASLACFSSAVAVRCFLHLTRAGRASVPEVRQATGLSPSSARKHLARLDEERWVVRLRDGDYRANWRRRLPGFRLSTVELKLTDYSRACRQLVHHTMYADRAVLVMPLPVRDTTRQRIIAAVAQYSASLVLVDDDRLHYERWTYVPRPQWQWKLCALGKACAQYAAC